MDNNNKHFNSDTPDSGQEQNDHSSSSSVSITPSNKKGKIGKTGNGGKSSNFIKGNSSYLLKNLSTSSICVQFRNENFLQTPYLGVDGEVVELKLKILPNNARLKLQSNSWAKKLAQNANIDFYKLGIGKDIDEWIPNLEKCFVYSYYKNLIHGLSSERIPEDESQFFCIPGHHILYCALKKPYHVFDMKDVTVRYSISATSEEFESIISKAEEFSYLKGYITNDGVWTYVNNSKIEQRLGRIKSGVTNSDPKIWSFSNLNSTQPFLSRESFPLFNSCYSSGNDLNNWFYIFDKTEELISPSTLFGKSLFLHARDDAAFQTYYHNIKVKDSKFFLIRYECRSVGASDKYPSPEVELKAKK